MNGFLTFIREQGVVGLAIGFILGGAVSKVVSSLVEDIIQPIIGIILTTDKSLMSLKLTIGQSTIMYGEFLVVLINFLVIAAVVYFIFKGLKLDHIDLKKK